MADEPQDAAAEAFEALRVEVAQLGAALEGLPTTVPDYSPTLAAMAQSLAAMEAHPALRLTPDALTSQVRQASEAAQQQGRRELANAVQRVHAAGAELERARTDGRRDTSVGPLRGRGAAYSQREPAGLGPPAKAFRPWNAVPALIVDQ